MNGARDPDISVIETIDMILPIEGLGWQAAELVNGFGFRWTGETGFASLRLRSSPLAIAAIEIHLMEQADPSIAEETLVTVQGRRVPTTLMRFGPNSVIRIDLDGTPFAEDSSCDLALAGPVRPLPRASGAWRTGGLPVSLVKVHHRRARREPQEGLRSLRDELADQVSRLLVGRLLSCAIERTECNVRSAPGGSGFEIVFEGIRHLDVYIDRVAFQLRSRNRGRLQIEWREADNPGSHWFANRIVRDGDEKGPHFRIDCDEVPSAELLEPASRDDALMLSALLIEASEHIVRTIREQPDVFAGEDGHLWLGHSRRLGEFAMQLALSCVSVLAPRVARLIAAA